MGRGRSKGSDKWKGADGVNPNNIVSERDMIVERGANIEAVDEILTVSRDFLDEYGESVPLQQLLISKMKGKDRTSTLAYYDGENVAVNERFMNPAAMEAAYAQSVISGFHPSRGNKSALAAVASHEFGHAATDAAAAKMGMTGVGRIDMAATRIVNEAASKTRYKSAPTLAKKISGYAQSSAAECIAEAVCDVYCNGRKAKSESRTVVGVLRSYLN